MLSATDQQIIIRTLAPLKPRQVAVFGSRARGTERHDSDLDLLLVDLRADFDLLELICLEQELSDLLGIKVHLVTERSLHPEVKVHVMKDLIPIISRG